MTTNFENRSIVVTGASGFMGTMLTTSLTKMGARVTALVQNVDRGRPLFRSPVTHERILTGDLRDSAWLERVMVEAEPEVVFHLGAVTQVGEAKRQPVHTFDINALGTLRVLEACRRVAPGQIRTVVATSDKVYGHNGPEGEAFFETDRLEPTHPYDVSKAAADLVARSFAKFYGESVQVIRLANVYGPGDMNFRRLIPGLIRDIYESRPMVLRSDGSPVRQYIYILDAIRAYVMLAQAMLGLDELAPLNHACNFGMAWNFGPLDYGHSVDGIVKILTDGFRQTGIVPAGLTKAESVTDESDWLFIDSSMAIAWFDWEPKVEIEEGIAKTIEWYGEMRDP